MGEVVVSSEGRTMILSTQEMELEKQIPQPAETKGQKTKAAPEGGGNAADGATSSAVVRWERFLPKLVVRVLLVEADDSTRQIIAALLRKCSYKGWFSGSNCFEICNCFCDFGRYLEFDGCGIRGWWDPTWWRFRFFLSCEFPCLTVRLCGQYVIQKRERRQIDG